MKKKESLENLHDRTEQALSAREYQQARKLAWQQLDINPLSEPALRQLMTALARSGQRSAALAQYEIYHKRLEEDSGEEPSAELAELYQRIQNDELEQTLLRMPAQPPPAEDFNPIFCYTDIESSTRLWDEHRETMLWALRQHNDLCETEIERYDGRILHPTGDGFLIVFEQNDPLQFAISLQQQFAQADWGEIGKLRIRIGLHGATVDQEGHEFFHDDGGWYRGPVLNHAARIADTGHGGQIVASDMVKAYCPLPPGASWEDLGSHNLKSLEEAYHINGLLHPALMQQEFPPLRTPANKHAAQLESRIRGYELGPMVGQGSFGEVYRAQQPGIERDVAVKIIRPRFANQPEFIRRFEMEAQVIARLEHPYIVPLYDYWREADGAYLVMRYMKGGSLKALLEEGPLDYLTALGLIDQAGTALAFAHQHGFVHRDIKPANILLDEAGGGYLSDFGIVRNLRDSGQEVDGALVTGTPAYLSPEQACGQGATPLSDQYSLAAMLYEMLTGIRAFEASSASNLIEMQLHEPLPLVTSTHPEIPPTVDEALQRATAKDPAARFSGIPAFLEALHLAARHMDAAYPMPAGLQLAAQDLVNPYKGLRSFQEADADNFFGRKDLTDQLLNRLAANPTEVDWPTNRFLAVVGPSGSGKSSVVKAGLLPALRRGDVPGSHNWFISEMVPGPHPFEELEAALLRVAIEPPDSLLAILKEDEKGLRRAIQHILPADGSELLLLIDQFEELYTLVAEEEMRAQFIDSLLAAIHAPDSRLRLVMTLRADFYDRPLMNPNLAALMRQYTEIVSPLTRRELEEVIVQPAAQSGVMFEARLVPAIIAEVSEQPGALPLLQYALTELFERRQERLLTHTSYEEIGGVLGALGRRAEELYEQLNDEGKEAARQLFMRLVTLGEGTEDTRRRVLRSELTVLVGALPVETVREHRLQVTQVMETVIDAYGRYRLLTFDHDPLTREPTVEVAHEALIREWDRLRGWLDDSRDDVRLQRSLALFATEWADHDRHEGYLLRDSRLDLLASWAAGTTLALTPAEQLYLQASIDAREQRLRAEEERQRRELETAQQLAREQSQRAKEQSRAARRLRLLVAGLAIVLLLAIGAAWLALNRGEEAQANADLAATREADALSEANQRATAQAQTEEERVRADEQRQAAEYAQATAVSEGQRADEQRDFALAAEAEARDAQQVAEEESIISQSRELAAAARSNLELDPELSILLALEALQIRHTIEAESALHQAIIASPLRKTLSNEIGTSWLATSPNSNTVYASGEGGGIAWDTTTGDILYTHRAAEGDWINRTDFSPDGSMLILSHESYDVEGNPMPGEVSIVDASSGEELVRFAAHDAWLQAAKFSPDGSRFATTGADLEIKVWDLESTLEDGSGRLVNTFCCTEWWYNGIDFSPDGQRLAFSTGNGEVIIWDITNGEIVAQIGPDIWYEMDFSPDGLYIVTAGELGNVDVWDANTGERLSRTIAHSGGAINHVQFSPDGTMLISASNDGSTILWGFSPGSLRQILEIPNLGSGIYGAGISPDNRLLYTNDGTVKIWDVSPSGSSELVSLPTHDVRSTDFEMLAEWERLLTVGHDGMMKLWDTESWEELRAVKAHEGRVQEVALSPRNGLIATVSIDDVSPKVWDVETWETQFTLDGHELQEEGFNRGVFSVVFRPDGKHLATAAADGTVRVWSAANGELIHTLGGHSDWVIKVRYSPDGRLLASAGGDGIIQIWDAETGENLVTMANEPPNGYWGISFSPDGQQIAAGRSSGQLELWQLPEDPWQAADEDAEQVYRVEGDTGWVASMSFSPDGTLIAVPGVTGLVEIRDAATGEFLLGLQHPAGVSTARFSTDGKRLMTSGWDGIFRIWALDQDELVDLAHSRVTRQMTQEECQHYLHTETCPES